KGSHKQTAVRGDDGAVEQNRACPLRVNRRAGAGRSGAAAVGGMLSGWPAAGGRGRRCGVVCNGLWAAVLLVIVAVLIARLWRGLTLPRGARREPACGGCGYAVRGLSELRCPECGADLREAGILTPRMLVRWRGSASGLVLAWTLLVVLVGVPAAVF